MNLAGAGRALWCVAAAGTFLAFVPVRDAPLCQAPLEIASFDGWTAEVACGAGGRSEELRGPARILFGERLDVNHADARTLETLPGIGPALAGRVVEARARGSYCTPVDLERVRGIGPVLRARMTPWLTFSAGGCPSGRSEGGL